MKIISFQRNGDMIPLYKIKAYLIWFVCIDDVIESFTDVKK